MAHRSARRAAASAAALVSCFVALEPPASADWISLSSNTPAEPGYLTNSDRFFVWLAATGVAAPRFYAAVFAISGEPPPADSKRDLAFVLSGGALGALIAPFLPLVEPGEPLFTYTLLDGMLWGMAGVGVAGAVSSSPRALWLGASVGHGAVALYRMGLSIGGYADYRSGAAAQIALGYIGASGCFLDALAAEGSEKYFAYACGGAFAIAMLHGVTKVTKRDKPWPKKAPPEGASIAPIPWVDRAGGGLSIAGVF